MKIDDILRKKGRDVVTVTESESTLAAVRRLVNHNIGGLVVVRDLDTVGIITERDILRLAAERGGELSSIPVGEVMTREVVTAERDDTLADMMDVMTERKIRHLPVLDDGSLCGIVSIGDLLNACRVEAEEENLHLRRYIKGAG